MRVFLIRERKRKQNEGKYKRRNFVEFGEKKERKKRDWCGKVERTEEKGLGGGK